MIPAHLTWRLDFDKGYKRNESKQDYIRRRPPLFERSEQPAGGAPGGPPEANQFYFLALIKFFIVLYINSDTPPNPFLSR